MKDKGWFYKQVNGRRTGDKGKPEFKIDWWKLLLVPALAWCTWVTLHGFLAESNRNDIEQLRTEKVAELKGYVDLQVGVLHARSTKIDDRINDVIWKFFEDKLAKCNERRETGEAE